MALDIINVAGLLLDGQRDGMEEGMRETLRPRSILTIAPTPPSSVFEDPEASIERARDLIRRQILDLKKRFCDVRVTLVGRSYGAFTALLAACREEFKDIEDAFLIEGPLNPDMEVAPPPLLPPLAFCYRHYRERPRLAREAIAALGVLGDSRITVIQGGREDQVVPVYAQILPGSENRVVQLDAEFGPGPDRMRSILPDTYRTHLFWSAEKRAAILSIIARTARETLPISA